MERWGCLLGFALEQQGCDPAVLVGTVTKQARNN